MKLHLPIVLLTALMAVLSALPTYAKFSLEIGGEKLENWDGYLTRENEQLTEYVKKTGGNVGYIDGDVTLHISKDGENDPNTTVYMYGTATSLNGTLNLRGNNKYTIDSGCSLVVKGNLSHLGAGTGGNNANEIKRDSSSTVDLYGTITSYGTTAALFRGNSGSNTSADINIHQGGVLRAEGWNESGTTYSGLRVTYAGDHHSTVTGNINVAKGGLIDACGMDIGHVGAEAAKTITRLTLDGGTYASTAGTVKGKTSKNYIGSISSTYKDASTDTTIIVKNGGTFSAVGGSTYIAEANGKTGGKAETKLTISVSGEGSSFSSDGTISKCGLNSGDEVEQYTKITVSDHAVFSFTGTELGSLPKSLKDTIVNLTTEIEVEDATFVLGGKATVGTDTDKYTMKEGKIETSFKMSGDSVLDVSTMTTGAIYGDVFISGGKIIGSETGCDNVFKRGVTVRTDASYTSTVDLGGLSGDKVLTGLQINGAGTTIQGIKEGSTLTISGTDNAFVVSKTSAQLGSTANFRDDQLALIGFQSASGVVNLADSNKLKLDFGGDMIGELASGNTEVVVKVWFTNGQLTSNDSDLKNHFTLGSGWGLSVGDVTFDAESNGILTITGKLDGVWFASGEDGAKIEKDLDDLQDMQKVIVDRDTTITANGAGTLKQLEGNSDLTLEGQGEISLENTGSAYTHGDTHYKGNISGTEGVDVKKTGSADFAMDGDISLAGNLEVANGSLTIGKTSTSSVGALKDVAKDAELVVDGKLTVGSGNASHASGSISGSGELALKGSLTLGDGASIEDVKLVLNDGTLDATAGKANLGELSGKGSLKGGVTVSGGQGEFSGALEGTLTLSGAVKQTLTGVSGNGSVDVQKGAQLELHVRGDKATDTVHLGNAHLEKGSTTVFNVHFTGDNLTHEALAVSGQLKLEEGAAFKLQEVGNVLPDGDLNCALITCAGVDGDLESVTVEYSNIFKLYYKNLRLEEQSNSPAVATFRLAPMPYAEDADTTVALVGEANTENVLTDVSMTDTAQAGSNLIFASLLSNEMLTAGTKLNELRNALADLAVIDPHAASRTMAAVAGSTVTSLGAAQRDALRGELLRLRTHATAATPETGKVTTWVEANGAFNSLHNDDDLSGYRLNAWGGSVGGVISPAKDVVFGMALSAQYGDLEAYAADSAKGDLDGYYLSFLGHVQHNAWGHSFIATLGRHQAKLNRTVNYGTGSYSTRGKTNGEGFGATYELTYDMPLSEDGSSVLQPMFNASIVTTSMKGYSEGGAGGAGLRVDDQTWTTGSVAVGARWLSTLDAQVFGKSVRTELRVNIAQDMGDNQGETHVALLANPTYKQRVRGAKVGSTALQLGAGIAVPVSESTQVYTGVNADLRNGSHQWNANLGVRIAF